ncbi:YkgB family protein [Desertibaculum subflavum]|uniref:YkgB family protein n=1 Tax=Desertibaculum subflavum TaxID=2268458 RepID=UPI000E661EA2
MFSTVHVPAAPPIAERLDRGLALIDRYGARAAQIGLYGSLALIYAWFGGMKFTAYEANGLVGLVEPSPLIGWFYDALSVQSFSNFLGVVELSIGVLIAARLAGPAWSLLGGLLSAGLFATTLSFLASTPGVAVPELGFPAITVLPGQFLLKDVGLLAISIWIAVDSLKSLRSHQA